VADQNQVGAADDTGWRWYDYNEATQEFSSRNVVYVVRTTDDRYFKLSVQSYYDAEGLPGFVTFQSEQLDAPSALHDGGVTTIHGVGGVSTTVVDASDGKSWVYWDIDAGEETLKDDEEWDIAVRQKQIITNGGEHRTGMVKVAVLGGRQLASIEQAPAEGYEEGGDGWNWYEQDLEDWLSPLDRVYVVHSTSDLHFGLSVRSYYGEDDRPGVLTFEWKVLDPPELN
jgi:hypothetical protein